MYIPLGGRKMAWLNVWPIFLFVAVWHDIEPKLLLWGALNSIFYVIEVWNVAVVFFGIAK